MTLALTSYDGLIVNGKWLAPDQTDGVINPATEDVFAAAPLGTTAEAELAIAAARAAFDQGPWPRLKPAERADALSRLLAVLTKWADDIAALTVAEVGTSAMTARHGQVDTPLRHLGHFIELARRLEPLTPLPTTLMDGRAGRVLGAGVV